MRAPRAALNLPSPRPSPASGRGGFKRPRLEEPLERLRPRREIEAALRDPVFYEWLALVDALRSGRARERRMAGDELTRRLTG